MVFTTRHKKVTTNPRDTIFWITDHNFFSHERFSTETGLYLRFLTHKKNYKNWGPTMSFRASKSGLGYEVQKKLEAVRLQNLYPCNIYRTVTSSLSISFITVQTEKTMLSLHVFRFNKYHHCFCPAWSNVLYHAFYSFLWQAACFLVKFILCLFKNFNIFLPQTNLEKSFQVSLCLSARRSTENSKIYF